ncbi:hybrid sensor histidine kinase/response regulator [Pseudanabaena sp. FACHB-1998]|uniref:hybrid sensor histidine kinase/response regulator n=1 Tax=Pseudanabaena sp. FACHB-1998 TaxID=2692858 RepID=UPI001680F84A|nr:hybrid sensor histidine kinase/response regulator [Pseudanabaena sp. FACHB-1998]MBD2176664.1 hybrid sensor histidine kinase/response regulator [Pseudanabaena sp. FACHB-1998]
MTEQNLYQAKEEKLANNASVLIVDDTIYNIQLLSLMLVKQGYQVEQANNGTEALDKVHQKLPDIILLDIRMPDINGYEVCKILKANPVTQDIPIIFISSVEEPSEKVEAFSVGGVDYISKPFQLIEVLARIETHLRLCSLQKMLQEQNEQLQLSASLLSRSLKQERELSQMKSNFISVVSHEFRTPLTTIQSASELLEYYEWTKEEQVEQLHQIQSEVKHMTALMEDVLFLSRANANKSKINLTEFDILVFCTQLLRQMQRTFGQKYDLHSYLYNQVNNTSIDDFHLQIDLPPMLVKMDEKLLRQILTNLITNAIKYSPENTKVDFKITINKENITFIISDHGIGIPEEDLGHLFSAFHRGKNVGILPGTGLGLSIVKNCVDIHKGFISVSSHLEVGTEFTVVLPILKELQLNESP